MRNGYLEDFGKGGSCVHTYESERKQKNASDRKREA